MPIECAACYSSYRRVIQPVLGFHVDRGLARLLFREIQPDNEVEPREDASLIVRCAAPSDQLRLVETYMAEFEQWGMAGDRPARIERLERIAATAGIALPQTGACLANDGWRSGLRKQNDELIDVFGRDQFPALLINGEIRINPSRAQVEETIYYALPPQERIKLPRPAQNR
jgi:hypothetical protein